LCFLVLTPLPRVLAFEIPVLLELPLGILVEIAVPCFAASIALVAATQRLATDGSGFRIRLQPTLASAGLAALVTCAVALLPYVGLLLSFLLGPLLFGPPIVAQVIAIEELSLSEALSRTRLLLAGVGGRAFLYLLNVGVGLGILSVLLIGGAMSFTIGADTIVRVLVASLYQATVLGAIVGFLATVEYVMFLELRARVTAADAIPD
jgi:hypothetical protein